MEDTKKRIDEATKELNEVLQKHNVTLTVVDTIKVVAVEQTAEVSEKDEN